MNDTHPAHIDAVARVMNHGTGGGNSQCVTSSKVCAEIVLDSTDPAVHAAMLDALTRHGVLTEERHSALLHDDGHLSADAYIEFCNTTARRLVTSWEVSA